MKLLVTSDWHSDWYTAGVRRHEDVANAAAATVKAAREHDCDFYLMLGDLSDPDTGAFWANSLAIKTVVSLPCSSYWIVGNHDIVEDGYGTHSMLPLAARGGNCTVVDLPKSFRLQQGTAAYVPKEGEKTAARAATPDTWLLCFPYTSTARTYDPIQEAEEMRKTVPLNSKVIIASHLMLEGIGPGSETIDMARGRDVFLPVEKLRELFPNCVIYNGHYHTAQTFNGVHIPGSLIRLTKGEIGNLPGYLIGKH